MKRTIKFWLITAIIAVTGLTITTCKEDDTHTHSWGDWVATALPTCISAGSLERICTDCSEKQIEDITMNPSAHNLKPTANIKKAATCTEEGFGELACAHGCGYTEAGGVIPMLDHDWEYTPGATEPTCTEPGSGLRLCTSCPETSIGGTYPAIGHDWIDNWEVKTVAVCTKDGEDIRKCDREDCNEEQTRVTEMLGHEWINNWAHTTPVTCTTNGEDTRICFRDDCTADEKRSVPMLNHVWLDNSWKETTPAACTAEGEEKRICDRTNCESAQTRAIEKLEHAWVYNSNAVPPTCTTQGSGLRNCSDCPATAPGGTYPALGHDYNDWIAPTCTTAGNSSRNCVRFANCGNRDTRSTGYAALGHINGNWEQTTLPACTTDGVMTGACVRGGCHDSTYKPTMKGDSALGHVWIENWTVKTVPTCTTAGENERICTRNNCDHIDKKTIEAFGHNWGNWTPMFTISTITNIAVTIPMTRSCSRNLSGSACAQTENRPLSDYIATQTEPVPLTVSIDLGNMGTANNGWTQLLSILAAANKKVALNLSGSTTSSQSFTTGVTTYSKPNGMDNIVSMLLPNSVTSIGENAFYNCKNLMEITLHAGLTSIGSNAFNGCTNLSVTWYYNPSSTAGWFLAYLKTVIVPDSVTSIGDFAFSGCSSLKEISLPNSLTTIGDYAFHNCTSLTEISLPNSVTSIGDGAFSGCSSLTSVTIPNSVTSIGSGAFYGCSGLTSITIPFVGNTLNGTSNTHFGSIFGASSQNSSIPSTLKTVVITGGSIGNWAFFDCTGLTSITIGNGVTSIGDRAFFDCTGLTSITIGNGVTSIGLYAFINCTSLTSVTIPNSVISIGSSAFWQCSGLTSVTIPDSMTSIGSSVFEGCTGLTSVTIPNSVTSIGSAAFAGCSSLTEITLPNSVTSIGNYAFSFCTSLTEISLPNSLTTIGNSAFEGCTNLAEITLPNSVTSIGDNYYGSRVFSGCTNLSITWYYNPSLSSYNFRDYLKTVIVPDGVTSIGGFSGCYSLTEITLPNSVTSISDNAFNNCTSLSEIILPNSVTSIGDNAFNNCTSLSEIILPNSVTSIGDNAFSFCTSLTKITLPAGASFSFGGGGFAQAPHPFVGCTSLTFNVTGSGILSVIDNGKGLVRNNTELVSYPTASGTITLPAGLTKIADYAFNGCKNLTKITLPAEVTIGYNAFSGCSSLTEITMPAGTSFSSNAFDSPHPFVGCTILTFKVTGSGVLSVIDNGKGLVRWRGTELVSYPAASGIITLPAGVTSIEDSAFSGCTNLTEISLPNSITSIGSYAFNDCTSLTSVTFMSTNISIRSGGGFPVGPSFPGDLRDKYLAGGIGTYTRQDGSYSWTKQ